MNEKNTMQVCPYCNQRRMPAWASGVTAVCCQHCHTIIERQEESAPVKANDD